MHFHSITPQSRHFSYFLEIIPDRGLFSLLSHQFADLPPIIPVNKNKIPADFDDTINKPA